ncbi:MAG TPA: hypothetical protein VGP24_05220, partial [Glaciihabitans sp.]|nr:hypothetical protein [Glaciihabitans sp.]
MTEPAAATTNTAESGSTIGIQADHVQNSTVYHNSTVYQVPPDATPRQLYEVGVRYLNDGVPRRARDLINEAIANGYENGEVRFHWMLAMLSKRSYRDLTPEEREQLAHIPKNLHLYADDQWKRALHAICELLECLTDTDSDPRLALTEL